jgi:hypothetical protein
MPTGTGYFDKTNQVYLPKSVETWDDFTGSSAGDDWDSLTSWAGTPSLPFTFQTDVQDAGSLDSWLLLWNVQTGGYFTTTVYADSDESSTGSTGSGVYTAYGPYEPGDSLPAIYGRWFYLVFTFFAPSSADDFDTQLQRIKGIEITFDKRKTKETVRFTTAQVIAQSGLSGTTGNYVYLSKSVSLPTNVQSTEHQPTDAIYVQADYVEDSSSAGEESYIIETVTMPKTYIDYGNSNSINIDIYDLNIRDSYTRIANGFDLYIEGYPFVSIGEHGNTSKS